MECNFWDTGWERFLIQANYVPKHLSKHDLNTIQPSTAEKETSHPNPRLYRDN